MAGLRPRGPRRRARGRCDLQRSARDRIHRRAPDDRPPRLADRAPGVGEHPAARVDCDDRRPAGHADPHLHDHQAPHDPRRRGDDLGLGRGRPRGPDRRGRVHDRAGGGRSRHAEERGEQLRRIRRLHRQLRAPAAAAPTAPAAAAPQAPSGTGESAASDHAKVPRTRPRRLRTRRATSRRPSGTPRPVPARTRPRRDARAAASLACARRTSPANSPFRRNASTL